MNLRRPGLGGISPKEAQGITNLDKKEPQPSFNDIQPVNYDFENNPPPPPPAPAEEITPTSVKQQDSDIGVKDVAEVVINAKKQQIRGEIQASKTEAQEALDSAIKTGKEILRPVAETTEAAYTVGRMSVNAIKEGLGALRDVAIDLGKKGKNLTEKTAVGTLTGLFMAKRHVKDIAKVGGAAVAIGAAVAERGTLAKAGHAMIETTTEMLHKAAQPATELTTTGLTTGGELLQKGTEFMTRPDVVHSLTTTAEVGLGAVVGFLAIKKTYKKFKELAPKVREALSVTGEEAKKRVSEATEALSLLDQDAEAKFDALALKAGAAATSLKLKGAEHLSRGFSVVKAAVAEPIYLTTQATTEALAIFTNQAERSTRKMSKRVSGVAEYLSPFTDTKKIDDLIADVDENESSIKFTKTLKGFTKIRNKLARISTGLESRADRFAETAKNLTNIAEQAAEAQVGLKGILNAYNTSPEGERLAEEGRAVRKLVQETSQKILNRTDVIKTERQDTIARLMDLKNGPLANYIRAHKIQKEEKPESTEGLLSRVSSQMTTAITKGTSKIAGRITNTVESAIEGTQQTKRGIGGRFKKRMQQIYQQYN